MNDGRRPPTTDFDFRKKYLNAKGDFLINRDSDSLKFFHY